MYRSFSYHEYAHLHAHASHIASATNTHSQSKATCKMGPSVGPRSELPLNFYHKISKVRPQLQRKRTTRPQRNVHLLCMHTLHRETRLRMIKYECSRYMPDQNGPHSTTLCFYQSDLAETFVDHHHVVWGFLSRLRDLLCQRDERRCECVCVHVSSSAGVCLCVCGRCGELAIRVNAFKDMSGSIT